ncbi:outer membrane lipoprotein-sorting protein [Thiomicrorhabdus sp.]|uniref:outer membrane lipoprotein-sorting protein n=1 Tax=Thiomicrorhabdus sp. TaxID=2039724 RepID=UPI002AA84A55|nr:outer membrane lipoprotein-sorting protein [Thiomicrorhabdus sp.]
MLLIPLILQTERLLEMALMSNKKSKHKFVGFAIILGFALSPVTMASSHLDAQEIFTKSVNIFTHKHMSFVIDSDIFYGEGVKEQRSFFIASKKQDKDNAALLLRFVAPQDIKCTAVLINKTDDQLQRYVYFPSLKRVRVIPESDKQKEVLGMGISYEEMTQPKGEFEAVKKVELDGKNQLQLNLIDGHKKTVIYVEPDSFDLKKILVYQDNVLQKEVDIKDIRNLFNQKIIFNWSIKDMLKKRTIDYAIRQDSVVNSVDDGLFYKNRLKRCIF